MENYDKTSSQDKYDNQNRKITAALISQGSTSSKWTFEAMKKYFSEVDMLNIKKIEVKLGKKVEILYEGKPLKKYDCIYAKGSFRFAQLLQSITKALSTEVYMPITPAAFTYGHNKLLTQIELQNNGVPMPATYLTATPESAKNLLGNLNYPIIMKFPEGTHGKGVLISDSYASASSMLDALTTLNQPFIIQEFIDTNGKDLRAIVIGNKVVASMERQAVAGEQRANMHAGGSAEPKYLDPITSKIAVEAAKAIGAEICAVDILETPTGSVVLEVNLSPGLQGITKTTHIDVADKIAKYLFERASELQAKHDIPTKHILDELGIESTKIKENKEVITTLDIRNGRLLLPKLVTDVTNFDDKKEVIIHIKEGRLIINKF